MEEALKSAKEWIFHNTEWMYWTWPSGAFFLSIFGAIFVLAIWEKISPTIKRKGFLPIPTTRGDRLFIGIISSIVIILLWLAFWGNADLVIPASIAAVWFIVQGIWG